jgi:hypothetical protein
MGDAGTCLAENLPVPEFWGIAEIHSKAESRIIAQLNKSGIQPQKNTRNACYPVPDDLKLLPR